jgi:hypothetical protein
VLPFDELIGVPAGVAVTLREPWSLVAAYADPAAISAAAKTARGARCLFLD